VPCEDGVCCNVECGGSQERCDLALSTEPFDGNTSFDHDGNRRVTVDELVRGIDSALHGCA
jgi:hypothetical protein